MRRAAARTSPSRPFSGTSRDTARMSGRSVAPSEARRASPLGVVHRAHEPVVVYRELGSEDLRGVDSVARHEASDVTAVGDDRVGAAIHHLQGWLREPAEEGDGVPPDRGPEDERLAARLRDRVRARELEAAVDALDEHVVVTGPSSRSEPRVEVEPGAQAADDGAWRVCRPSSCPDAPASTARCPREKKMNSTSTASARRSKNGAR